MKITELKKKDLENNDVFIRESETGDNIKSISVKESIPRNSGSYFIPGEVRLRDGTKYSALFEISSDDGGEMFGYNFLVGNIWVSNRNDVEKALGKKANEIVPFAYHLNTKVDGDFHTPYQY